MTDGRNKCLLQYGRFQFITHPRCYFSSSALARLRPQPSPLRMFSGLLTDLSDPPPLLGLAEAVLLNLALAVLKA